MVTIQKTIAITAKDENIETGAAISGCSPALASRMCANQNTNPNQLMTPAIASATLLVTNPKKAVISFPISRNIVLTNLI
jgi:hypothetical protein